MKARTVRNPRTPLVSYGTLWKRWSQLHTSRKLKRTDSYQSFTLKRTDSYQSSSVLTANKKNCWKSGTTRNELRLGSGQQHRAESHPNLLRGNGGEFHPNLQQHWTGEVPNGASDTRTTLHQGTDGSRHNTDRLSLLEIIYWPYVQKLKLLLRQYQEIVQDMINDPNENYRKKAFEKFQKMCNDSSTEPGMLVLVSKQAIYCFKRNNSLHLNY